MYSYTLIRYDHDPDLPEENVHSQVVLRGCSAAGDQSGAAGTQQIQAETEQNETKGEQTQASDQTHSRIAYRFAGREEGQKLCSKTTYPGRTKCSSVRSFGTRPSIA